MPLSLSSKFTLRHPFFSQLHPTYSPKPPPPPQCNTLKSTPIKRVIFQICLQQTLRLPPCTGPVFCALNLLQCVCVCVYLHAILVSSCFSASVNSSTPTKVSRLCSPLPRKGEKIHTYTGRIFYSFPEHSSCHVMSPSIAGLLCDKTKILYWWNNH